MTGKWTLRLAVLASLAAAHTAQAATVRWFIAESNVKQTAWMRDVAKAYEAAHPGTVIAVEVMSSEPYKGKLTTMLQSQDRPDLLRTSQLYRQLIEMEPFQKGLMGDTGSQAAGQFGDGRVAMAVIGNWHYPLQKNQSADQKGRPDDEIGWMPFPTVPGGKGDPSDLLSGINGFLVTKDAPPEAVSFLRYYTSLEVQGDAAKQALFIPVAKGVEKSVANPFFRDMATRVQNAKYLQNYWDQMLGPQAGRIVNDASADLASGRITPVQMGKNI